MGNRYIPAGRVKEGISSFAKKGKTALDLILTERMELPEDMKIKEYPGAKDHKLFKFSMANDGSIADYKDK